MQASFSSEKEREREKEGGSIPDAHANKHTRSRRSTAAIAASLSCSGKLQASCMLRLEKNERRVREKRNRPENKWSKIPQASVITIWHSLLPRLEFGAHDLARSFEEQLWKVTWHTQKKCQESWIRRFIATWISLWLMRKAFVALSRENPMSTSRWIWRQKEWSKLTFYKKINIPTELIANIIVGFKKYRRIRSYAYTSNKKYLANLYIPAW